MSKERQLRLGDMVGKITKALHIPHCDKCEQRRLILNEIQKVGVKETIKRMKSVTGSSPKDEDLKKVIAKLTDCCKE